MKTLIIGLGNPILGDDGVGWKVVEAVQSHIKRRNLPIECDCLSLGGLTLMERMLGYERVILVDAVVTGQNPAGSVQVIPLDALPNPSAGHSTSAHDTSLLTALQAAQLMGWATPREIQVVSIEAKQIYDFSEELSSPVAAAIPQAVQAVLQMLEPANEYQPT